MNISQAQGFCTPKGRRTPQVSKQKSKFKIVFPVHALSPSENRAFTLNAPEKVCNDFYRKFFKEKLFPITSKNAPVQISEMNTQADRSACVKVLNMKPNQIRQLKSRSPERQSDAAKQTTLKSMKINTNASQQMNSNGKLKERPLKDNNELGKRLAHNFTKLRIVSRDKVDEETKKTNYMPLTSKEPLIIRNVTKTNENSTGGRIDSQGAIDPKKVGFYLKLKRLAAKKSKSIEPHEGSLHKSKKDDAKRIVNQSEDRCQTRYILHDNFFKQPTESAHCFINSRATDPPPNRFLKTLHSELANSEEIQMISDHIRKVFSTWTSKSSVRAFKFKTQNLFYRIVEKIGMGCFGKVYLATQILTNTPVALKVISKSDIQAKNYRSKIEKEIEVLKLINSHRYVIKLMEVFEDDNSVYFVFEYVKNGDLVQYFRQNPLMEEPELKQFFHKILKGVEYLHRNKVIHRDIKLDNILLDEDLQPKLCDFGISSLIEDGQVIMDTGGTPAYLAPEVIKAEGKVCEKSDVWSLGVLLFLMNFGTVPFKSADMQNLYSKIILGHFKFPMYDDVSIEVIDLIKRMLVVDVDSRLSVEGVLKHRWFRDIPDKPLLEDEGSTDRASTEISEASLRYLADLGFPEDYIKQSLRHGLFNHLKACVDCLKIRFSKR